MAKGLSTLVDNALAHPLLKVVLPQLEPLLFDSATKVRTAMADLLLSLRYGGCCRTALRVGLAAFVLPLGQSIASPFMGWEQMFLAAAPCCACRCGGCT